MGIIIDTSIFIHSERSNQTISSILSNISTDEEVYISTATVSELLVGVYRANTEKRRII
ncbi:MAG TPA: type II toxin-antitoxin system VapC family toxin, partial [Trueperaceae bacterium]|nr:type II toxin-antitoxin system VapC family toxin [Trueperaceae bacterium]